MKKTVLSLCLALLAALLTASAFALELVSPETAAEAFEGTSAAALTDTDASLLVSEDFESFAVGNADVTTWPFKLQLSSPVYDDIHLCMGDYTISSSVAADPFDADNKVLKVYSEDDTALMVEIERNRKDYDLGFTDAGRYVLKAKVYNPALSGGIRLTFLTDSTDNNGRSMRTIGTSDSWQTIEAAIDIDPMGSDTVLKAIKFWIYPFVAGEYYLDDIEIRYYNTQVVFYTDETMTTPISTVYSAVGSSLAFPSADTFYANAPDGTMLSGFNAGGSFAALGESYIIKASDVVNGFVKVYPVYSPIMDATLLIKEDFNGYPSDGSVFANVSNGGIPLASPSDKYYRLCMGDNTILAAVADDPLDATNKVLKVSYEDDTVLMVEIEKTRKNFDLGWTDAGRYVLTAKVYNPAISNGIRLTFLTNSTDNNGRTMRTIAANSAWQTIEAAIDVDPSGSDTVLKAMKFWTWPTVVGEYYIDDIEVHYYNTQVVYYTDSSKTTQVSSSYSGVGAKLEFPQPGVFASYAPEGKIVTGLNIAGSVYSFHDSYTIEESDLTNGVLEIYPVYTDVNDLIALNDPEYGELVFFDNFETAAPGTYNSASLSADFPAAMYIAPAYAANAESRDFCWSYGDTIDLNIVYDDASDNTAIRMGGHTINQIFMRRPATYGFYEKGNFANALTTPGIYTITMEYIIPDGQSFSEVGVRSYDNRCARDDGLGDERKNTPKFESAANGGTVTVTQQIAIPDAENGIDELARFDFIARASSADDYCYLDNVALYYKPFAPETMSEINIRTTGSQGLRFNGFVSETLLNYATEFGFLAARAEDANFDDTTGFTDLVFPDGFVSAQGNNVTGSGTTASGVKFVCGTSYDLSGGIAKISPTQRNGVNGFKSSGVLIGLDGRERMMTDFAVRVYAVVDGVYYYGDVQTANIYDVAKALANDPEYASNDYIQSIIATCEAE